MYLLFSGSYDQAPKPERQRLEKTSRDFVQAVKSSLKSKSFGTIYASIDLDVWRYITAIKVKNVSIKDTNFMRKSTSVALKVCRKIRFIPSINMGRVLL